MIILAKHTKVALIGMWIAIIALLPNEIAIVKISIQLLLLLWQFSYVYPMMKKFNKDRNRDVTETISLKKK